MGLTADDATSSVKISVLEVRPSSLSSAIATEAKSWKRWRGEYRDPASFIRRLRWLIRRFYWACPTNSFWRGCALTTGTASFIRFLRAAFTARRLCGCSMPFRSDAPCLNGAIRVATYPAARSKLCPRPSATLLAKLGYANSRLLCAALVYGSGFILSFRRAPYPRLLRPRLVQRRSGLSH